MRRYRLATGQTTTVSVGALALADLWLHGTARTRELILTEVGEPALHGCLLARRGLLDRPGSGSRLDYSGAPS
jgi:hypothetical protein